MAPPTWTKQDGERGFWFRVFSPARDTPRWWVLVHLLLILSFVERTITARTYGWLPLQVASDIALVCLALATIRRAYIAVRRPT